MDRRVFLKSSVVAAGLPLLTAFAAAPMTINTVTGVIAPGQMGKTLIHEHILVDFIGAEKYDPQQWNDDDVITKMLPFLKELKKAGCKTFIDCTPNYLGRDVLLLKRLSELSGLQIVTNTGYYGGSDTKYLPAHAFKESADQLAKRWIAEYQKGIDKTEIRPGFVKISVNAGALSDISKKLIKAAARTHLRTGLTLASHTGPAIAAFEQLDILAAEGVAPDAFIWVHAQMENDRSKYVEAARKGAWVSFDGLEDIGSYVSMLLRMKKEKCLHRVLISQDAGWYDPQKPEAKVRGYAMLFTTFLPTLKANGFTDQEIRQLIEINPQTAFTIRVRKKF